MMRFPDAIAYRAPRQCQIFVFLGALLFFFAAAKVEAVIFYSTGDPNYNSSSPTGALANSGWQWEGNWQGYCGTPIGPQFFISAAHVGGTVGQPFVFNGVSYPTVASFPDAQTDLIIWQIAGTFPSWAPLYQSSDEMGKALVVIGRGLSRGGAITVNSILKGWYWGADAGVLRWGQNNVAAIVDGGATMGSFLYATFDKNAALMNPNEAHLALGDSSGGIFIQTSGGWALAGIAYAVDGPFNTTNMGPGFQAALFDASGLYYQSNGNWQLISQPTPTGFYASRISSRIAWIESVITPAADDVPLPAATNVVLAAAFLGIGSFFLSRKPRPARTYEG